jgi:hypothetical protein
LTETKWPTEPKNIYCLALYGQSLPTPDLCNDFRMHIQNKDGRIACEVLKKRKACSVRHKNQQVGIIKKKSAQRDEFYKAELLKKVSLSSQNKELKLDFCFGSNIRTRFLFHFLKSPSWPSLVSILTFPWL